MKIHLTLVVMLSSFVTGLVYAGETGTVQGRVTYSGKAPKPRMLVVSKDSEICGHDSREFRWIDVNADGALRDVVLFLDDPDFEGDWEHPEEGYTLTQKGCRFEPYILLYTKDRRAKLNIVNGDATLHNVRITQILGRVTPTLLNLSQPQGKPPKVKPLRVKPGSPAIEVKCDVHEFMQGWIFAADNPHSVLAGEDGTFELTGLPPGEHMIGAWHPYLGFKRAQVNVSIDGESTLEFSFSIKDFKP